MHLFSGSESKSLSSNRQAALIEPLEGRVLMDASGSPGRPGLLTPTGMTSSLLPTA